MKQKNWTNTDAHNFRRRRPAQVLASAHLGPVQTAMPPSPSQFSLRIILPGLVSIRVEASTLSEA